MKYLLSFILFCLLAGPSTAKECQDNKDLCVYSKQDKDGFHLYARNVKAFDITLTLTAQYTNLEPAKDLPYSTTIKGQKERKLLSFFVIDSYINSKLGFQTHYTAGSMYAKHKDNYLYRLPYKHATFRLDQGYDSEFSHFGDHRYALDWSMPVGTPIVAARGGTVVNIEERYTKGGVDPKYKTKANFVWIRHVDRTIGVYAHLKHRGAAVKIGQKIRPGQLIGYSGQVGYASGPHLHFHVFKALSGQRRFTIPVKFKTLEEPDGTILIELESYEAL